MSSDEDFLGARASRPHKAWHGLAYLSHFDQPRTAPFPVYCVKDVPGLYRKITPPLRESRRSRAAKGRLMRWGDGRLPASSKKEIHEGIKRAIHEGPRRRTKGH